MRYKLFIVITLSLVLSSMAASTISGVAVAAQWNGGNDNVFGGYGNIVKYVIANGAVTGTSVLFSGSARYATISPDGQKVAFIKNNNAIAVVDVARKGRHGNGRERIGDGRGAGVWCGIKGRVTAWGDGERSRDVD